MHDNTIDPCLAAVYMCLSCTVLLSRPPMLLTKQNQRTIHTCYFFPTEYVLYLVLLFPPTYSREQLLATCIRATYRHGRFRQATSGWHAAKQPTRVAGGAARNRERRWHRCVWLWYFLSCVLPWVRRHAVAAELLLCLRLSATRAPVTHYRRLQLLRQTASGGSRYMSAGKI